MRNLLHKNEKIPHYTFIVTLKFDEGGDVSINHLVLASVLRQLKPFPQKELIQYKMFELILDASFVFT